MVALIAEGAGQSVERGVTDTREASTFLWASTEDASEIVCVDASDIITRLVIFIGAGASGFVPGVCGVFSFSPEHALRIRGAASKMRGYFFIREFLNGTLKSFNGSLLISRHKLFFIFIHLKLRCMRNENKNKVSALNVLFNLAI